MHIINCCRHFRGGGNRIVCRIDLAPDLTSCRKCRAINISKPKPSDGGSSNRGNTNVTLDHGVGVGYGGDTTLCKDRKIAGTPKVDWVEIVCIFTTFRSPQGYRGDSFGTISFRRNGRTSLARDCSLNEVDPRIRKYFAVQ